MRLTRDRFEYTNAQEEFFDFCLWKYTPLVSCENKFRSVNLLYHSFQVAGADKRVFDLVDAIREAFGVSRTVWGLKKLGDTIRWEFYFYDYRRRERERSVKKLLDALRPLVRCPVTVNENLYYFMFSIDIDNELITGSRDLEELHVYVGNPGSTVSSGISYSFTAYGTRLENYYFFFDARKQQSEILAKAVCSAHIDSAVITQDRILWPELRDCRIIVVANKQENDSVYFSGITIDQLIFFLTKMSYPGELVSFAEENRNKLDHLLFDVGLDYRMEGKDLVFLKSGYYGIF